MNREELVAKVKELKPIVDAKYQAAFEAKQQAETEVKALFRDLVDAPHSVDVSFGWDLQVRIKMLDDKGEDVFATDIEIWCRKQYKEQEKKIFASVGGLGSIEFTDTAYVNTYRAYANFWNNYEKYAKAIMDISNRLEPIMEDFSNTNKEKNNYEREIERMDLQAEIDNTLNTIKVGNEYVAGTEAGYRFKQDEMRGSKKLRVKSITDKNIVVDFLYLNWKGTEYFVNETGRIDKDTFVSWIRFNKVEKEA